MIREVTLATSGKNGTKDGMKNEKGIGLILTNKHICYECQTGIVFSKYEEYFQKIKHNLNWYYSK